MAYYMPDTILYNLTLLNLFHSCNNPIITPIFRLDNWDTEQSELAQDHKQAEEGFDLESPHSKPQWHTVSLDKKKKAFSHAWVQTIITLLSYNETYT